jgi:hypothetical protein
VCPSAIETWMSWLRVGGGRQGVVAHGTPRLEQFTSVPDDVH